MYSHPNVKTAPDFPVPDTMKAWILGVPGELSCRKNPRRCRAGGSAGPHRRGGDLRDRPGDHPSRSAGDDRRRHAVQQAVHARP